VSFPGPVRNVRKKRLEGDEPASGNPAHDPPRADSPARKSKAPASAKPAGRESRVPGESRVLRVLRIIVGVIVVVAIGGSAAWGARRYTRTSARFAVSEIVTTGGKRRTPEELATLAGIAKGQNVFTIDLDRSRTRLVADPWISEATLSRQLPGTIFIRVTEREAAGIVAMPQGTYLVTREGSIIKRLEPGDPTELHVITGISLQNILDDREGAARTIRRALDLATEYERSPLATRSQLEEVHVETNGDMSLVIGKSGVVLRMCASPDRRKLDQAVRVVAELDRRGAKPDAIMLDNDARPDRVVVRVR
jgi:cell division protein FtsQ